MKWILILLLTCGVAAARPGGGQSFSSGGGGSFSVGGGSYGHSSSGGGASGVGVAIAVSLGVMFFAVFTVIMVGNRNQERLTTSAQSVRRESISFALVRERDPAFSRIVFQDFAYELYAAAQRARHDAKELAKLAPYVSERARTELQQRRTRVEQVVVGSMSTVAVSAGTGTNQIVVRFEANLANRAGSTFAVERWRFERAIDRKTTPPPVGARTWPCPSCGAPWSAGENETTCAHCGAAITASKLDWAVTDIEVETETPIGITLTGTTAEVGNDFPTVETGEPERELQALRTADTALTWPDFVERVKLVYARLNDAWNAQDLTPVRGLVTQSLLQYLQYWIDEYKRQGLHNRLDDATVSRTVLAAVIRDPYFDAITVRIYACGHDYTLRGDRVVGGSKDSDRAYTEYWTFIRSAKRRGATLATPNCPNCGAPLAISDAGSCTHCSAHVESGELDWVLSRIEQDDVYRG